MIGSRDHDLPRRTRWQKLRASPLRDLVRGRATGRLDLSAHSQRAQLPEGLSALVLRTTRMTRLRALEKADVARELSAHFAEGLAGGQDAAALAEAFGDPRQAAKLIRRAKKRNRSRVVRAIKRTTLGAFAALALLYLGVLIWYVAGSGSVNPSHDYLADLNAQARAVPEDQRAWPVYREAFLRMGPIPEGVRDCRGADDPCWSETTGFIAAHQDEIGMLRRGASMGGMGFIVGVRHKAEDLPLFDPEAISSGGPPDGTPCEGVPTIDALLPQLGCLRDAARLLRFDAIVQHDSGQTSNAIDDIAAMIGVARHAGEQPTLISQLVRISITMLAVEATNQILTSENADLTDRDLARLSGLFRPSVVSELCAISTEGERIFLGDFVQHAYTDNGRGNGRVHPGLMEEFTEGRYDGHAPLLLAAPISAVLPDRKAFTTRIGSFFDAADQEYATPMWDREGGLTQRVTDELVDSAWESIVWSALLSIFPSFDRVITAVDIAAMQADACHAAIALHRYRLAHGGWPDSLARLVPDYLSAVPLDRFDGHPMRYRLDAAGAPVLYSIGANYKDDAGVPGFDVDGWPTNDATSQWRPRSEAEQRRDIPEGDYILWPPLPPKPVEPDAP